MANHLWHTYGSVMGDVKESRNLWNPPHSTTQTPTFLWSSPGSSDLRSSRRVAKYHADLEDDERIAEIAAVELGDQSTHQTTTTGLGWSTNIIYILYILYLYSIYSIYSIYIFYIFYISFCSVKKCFWADGRGGGDSLREPSPKTLVVWWSQTGDVSELRHVNVLSNNWGF